MEPWLPDGSPIFVERTSEVGSGGRYVLWLDDVDAEIVKRIERFGGGYLRIISDNPAHASQTLRHIADDMFEDQATGATVRWGYVGGGSNRPDPRFLFCNTK